MTRQIITTIKRTDLNNLVKRIATLTGLTNNKAEAIEKGQPRYYFLDFNPIYGGYRLVLKEVNSGGEAGCFGGNGMEDRLSATMMGIRLRGIIDGLNFEF